MPQRSAPSTSRALSAITSKIALRSCCELMRSEIVSRAFIRWSCSFVERKSLACSIATAPSLASVCRRSISWAVQVWSAARPTTMVPSGRPCTDIGTASTDREALPGNTEGAPGSALRSFTWMGRISRTARADAWNRQSDAGTGVCQVAASSGGTLWNATPRRARRASS